MVSFGAAASPDLTILPVFLAATTAGRGRRDRAHWPPSRP